MRDITEKIKAIQSEKELQQNRELTAIIQEHVEDERKSLARELHDELGQYVSAIKIFTQNIVNRSKGQDKVIEESASTVMSAANQIYDGMHNIIRKLRPGALDNLGLSETIHDFVNTSQEQYKELKIDFDISGDINNLGEMININIYRIIQESMNNCIKHARASKVILNISRSAKNIKILFTDNGVGFSKEILKNSKQFGLVGIEERVKSLRGNFKLDSAPKKGTTLKIQIPLEG
jgi:signal transduction histidine kinase